MCNLPHLATWEIVENELPSVGGRRKGGGLSSKGSDEVVLEALEIFKSSSVRHKVPSCRWPRAY